MKTVQAGRDRLQVAMPEEDVDEDEEGFLEEYGEGVEGFYDQDSG